MSLFTKSDPPEFISRQVTEARCFYFNLKPRPSASLEVVCGGREACAADYRIDRATFRYWAIEFVAAGRGSLRLSGKTVRLEPGVMFAYGPGFPHRLETDPNEPLVKYFVNFIGRPAKALMAGCGLSPGASRSVPTVGDIRDAFEQLLKLSKGPTQQAEHVCSLQLEILLHLVAEARKPASTIEGRARETYERIRAYIDQHFLKVNTVAEIAEACHVDSSHLSRLSRRFGGEPPLRHLQRRKMQWAAERLQNPACLVRHVADELGTDPFNFSRTFKRVHGLAPSEFQKAVG